MEKHWYNLPLRVVEYELCLDVVRAYFQPKDERNLPPAGSILTRMGLGTAQVACVVIGGPLLLGIPMLEISKAKGHFMSKNLEQEVNQ